MVFIEFQMMVILFCNSIAINFFSRLKHGDVSIKWKCINGSFLIYLRGMVKREIRSLCSVVRHYNYSIFTVSSITVVWFVSVILFTSKTISFCLETCNLMKCGKKNWISFPLIINRNTTFEERISFRWTESKNRLQEWSWQTENKRN